MDADSTPKNPTEGNTLSISIGEQRLFTVPQAAKALSLGESTVWQLIYDKKINSVKIGNSRRIRREALDEFVNSLEEAA